MDVVGLFTGFYFGCLKIAHCKDQKGYSFKIEASQGEKDEY